MEVLKSHRCGEKQDGNSRQTNTSSQVKYSQRNWHEADTEKLF